MSNEYISFRCLHCGKVLEPSDIPEYDYQCRDCDEDFYAFEAIRMTIVFTTPSTEDQQSIRKNGCLVDLADYTKVSVSDNKEHSSYMYVDNPTFHRLGCDYIKDHVWLEYSSFLEEWSVRMSQNDFHNDQKRNPDKIIPVTFFGIENGTGREVYEGADAKIHYLRGVSTRANFAKWLICNADLPSSHGSEPRANLIFRHGDQEEKVTYDDWNGVCAYSNTFNKNFRT